MYRQLLKAKIFRATVTDARIDYEGSIAIDEELLRAADIRPWEKVLIANLNNGSRIESYAIAAEAGSGTISLNGGAAKYGQKGDTIIIMTFGVFTEEEAEEHEPKIVYVDQQNRILSLKS